MSTAGNPWRQVTATSFADPADVHAYTMCRERGGSERQCLQIGDNGIGLWGDTTTGDVPMCALHPEDWHPYYGAARGKLVEVEVGGRRVICELRDTLGPVAARAYRGKRRIDLNPGALRALGLRAPLSVPARWRWAE